MGGGRHHTPRCDCRRRCCCRLRAARNSPWPILPCTITNNKSTNHSQSKPNPIPSNQNQEYDPFDDGALCRSRFWLFLSYVVSFAALVAAVWVLAQDYALNPAMKGQPLWPGVAGVFQVTCILGAGLVFFVSRTPADGGGGYGGYQGF